MQLLPYMQSQMTENTSRVDAIWDTYQEASLKSQTRAKRGETSSRRTRVSAKIPIPKGVEWQKFLKDNQNKDELFQFICQELQRSTVESTYHLLTTKADIVLSNKATDITAVSPCQQEEADTRMMLHLRHAAMQGHTKAYVRTDDSDVVVLTISIFHKLGLSELWVGFGTGKSYKDIPIHHISQLLGPQRCKVLPLFNAITGCDVVSTMFGIGKNTACNALIAYPEVTDTLIAITQDPNSFTLDSLHMRHLERWTVLMYSKNCNAELVNDARKLMFSHNLRSLDSIPPSKSALFQHIKRALVVAAFIWKQSLSKTPEIPKPSEWGMEHQDKRVGTILDRSVVRQPGILAAPPLWL